MLSSFLVTKGEKTPLPKKNSELYPLVMKYRKDGEDIFSFSEPIWERNDQTGESRTDALEQTETEDDTTPLDRQTNHGANTAEDENSYSEEKFLKEVFMTKEQYSELKELLERKKNIILTGAPGVGKTFAAKRLAWSMIGTKSHEQVELIQFHQSYSYEDFIRGYKPNTNGGFELKDGVFYRFCKKAEENPQKQYFFLIDEINRGNLSKIFGEVLLLMEKDYRDKQKVELAYRKDKEVPFSIPEKVYIIGMMNTADRSLALIDYALRRRFGTFAMTPNFDRLWEQYKDNDFINNSRYKAVIELVKALNKEIEIDPALGDGFCIGHSYFIPDEELKKDHPKIDKWLKSVIDFDILPLLKEYWFDDSSKVENWGNDFYQKMQS